MSHLGHGEHQEGQDDLDAMDDDDAAARDETSAPSDDALDAFKADVRTWLELDNSIRGLQASIRERRNAKRGLTSRVLDFMARYNIEDLSTRDGRLRSKVSYVRAPLSHQAIRTRIDTFFSADAAAAFQLSGAVFGNRERCERTSLRRLGGGGREQL